MSYLVHQCCLSLISMQQNRPIIYVSVNYVGLGIISIDELEDD